MKILQLTCLFCSRTFSVHHGSTPTSPQTTQNSQLHATVLFAGERERERSLCALVSSVCHARPDEEEVEVWEAERWMMALRQFEEGP